MQIALVDVLAMGLQRFDSRIEFWKRVGNCLLDRLLDHHSVLVVHHNMV